MFRSEGREWGKGEGEQVQAFKVRIDSGYAAGTKVRRLYDDCRWASPSRRRVTAFFGLFRARNSVFSRYFNSGPRQNVQFRFESL